jgi:hypothetical protein
MEHNGSRLRLCRRVTRRCVPRLAFRNFPIAVASPLPVRGADDLLLRLDKHVNRAHAVFLLGTAANAGERDHAVVDDDADLVSRKGQRVTREQLELDVGREGRELGDLEGSIRRDVIGGKWTVGGERRQIERRQD